MSTGRKSKAKSPEGRGSEIEQLSEFRWYWRGMHNGREDEVWAWIDIENREIGFAAEPADPNAKHHEGGSATYALSDFRRGAARGWHKEHPELYRCVCLVVDQRYPE